MPEPAEVVRERAREMEGGVRYGMNESKFGGMQGEARRAARVRKVSVAADRPPVNSITAEGMTGFAKVDPDLMGAASLKATRDQGVPGGGRCREAFDVGDGGLAQVAVGGTAAITVAAIIDQA